jgi:phytoene synthase
MDDDAPAEDLDALIRRVDPDRWISSRFAADSGRRADLVALYAFDHALARAPRVASNPLIGEMRLAWWREALDEIFEDRPVRRHPTAVALADAVRRRGIGRTPLDAMVDARYRELDAEALSRDEAMNLAFGSAGSAGAVAIQILGGDPERGFASAWPATWSLARMVLEARIRSEDVAKLRSEISLSIAEARTVERGDVSATAFPAVAHAALAPVYAAGRRPGLFEKQLRLTWAVARGRI